MRSFDGIRGRSWRAVGLTLVLAAACRTSGAPPVSLEESVRRVCASLEAGQIEDAVQFRERALHWWGREPVVQQWAAAVSMATWDFRTALFNLRQARAQLAERGGSVVEVERSIGELLFLNGRYQEAVPWLEGASPGDMPALSRALVRLARDLPDERWELELGAPVELPLLEGPLPQVVCAIGERRRTFVIDTGSSVSAVGRSVAAELAVSPILPAGDVVDGAGQVFPADIGLLPSLALGEAALGRQPVLIVADARMALRASLGEAAYPVAGVVGLDVLHRMRLTLDPDRKAILIEPRRQLDRLDALRCLWAGESGLLVPVVVERQSLWFRLDTGASHSSLTLDGLRALPDGAARAVQSPRRVRGVGGTQMSVQEVRNLDLVFGDVRFRGIDLPVVDRKRLGHLPVHGVMGADLVLRCRITLDGGLVRATP